MLFLCLSLLGLTTPTSAADPLKDFCRLHGHQTAVVDRKLYVDGGLVNWAPLAADPVNYTSTWLKAGDFDVSHDGFPQQSVLAKNETVPSVSGGVLWPDEVNKVIYAYGGEYGNGQPQQFKLWFYDIIYNTWNVSSADTSNVRRAAWGAGAINPDKAVGYYYGGWLTSSSEPGYNTPTAIDTLLTYDMVANRFRNQSGPDNVRRAEGALLYIPAGDAGALIYIGGIQVQNGTRSAHPMTDILIHDIGNSRWYSQTAHGPSLPSPRRRFCAGAVWTPDRSSYNIYLFGGASIDSGTGFGDVWILSLPSFTWTKFFPTPDDAAGEIPHHSASCDVYAGSQMLIMGGHFPNSSACDVPAIYGQHGLDLGRANPLGAKWAAFNASRTSYSVPPELTSVIGGHAAGGATATKPQQGWDTGDLAIVFERSYTPAARQPTRHIPSAAPHAASNAPSTAMLGSAIGAVGALVVVGVVALCLCARRRRHRRNESVRYHSPSPDHPSLDVDVDIDTKSPSPSHSPIKSNPPPAPHAELPGCHVHTPTSPISTSPSSSRRSRASDTESVIVWAPLLDAPLLDPAARPWLREGRLVCELEGVEGVRGKDGGWRGAWV